jgi:hypothetical protein
VGLSGWLSVVCQVMSGFAFGHRNNLYGHWSQPTVRNKLETKVRTVLLMPIYPIGSNLPQRRVLATQGLHLPCHQYICKQHDCLCQNNSDPSPHPHKFDRPDLLEPSLH